MKKSLRQSQPNTIRALSISYQEDDAWSELNSETNLNDLVFRLQPHHNYRIRILGSFMRIRRAFIPQHIAAYECMTDNELMKILNGSLGTKQIVIDRINKDIEEYKVTKSHKRSLGEMKTVANTTSYFNPKSGENFETRANQVIKLIQSFGERDRMGGAWGKQVVVNVLNRALLSPDSDSLPPIGIFVMGHKLLVDITSKLAKLPQYTGQGTINLSGLYAVDLGVARRHQPYQPSRGNGTHQFSYDIHIFEPSRLTDAEINFVLSHGLIDIPLALKDINERTIQRRMGYLYKKASQYIMPDQYWSELKEQFKNVFAESHQTLEKEAWQTIDDNMDDLPMESFENQGNLRHTINSLEL
ncbi:MAG: hypothetical protein WC375_08675 [Methanomassiliicoccales archaeon]|jgi:hypothetical protein